MLPFFYFFSSRAARYPSTINMENSIPRFRLLRPGLGPDTILSLLFNCLLIHFCSNAAGSALLSVHTIIPAAYSVLPPNGLDLTEHNAPIVLRFTLCAAIPDLQCCLWWGWILTYYTFFFSPRCYKQYSRFSRVHLCVGLRKDKQALEDFP